LRICLDGIQRERRGTTTAMNAVATPWALKCDARRKWRKLFDADDGVVTSRECAVGMVGLFISFARLRTNLLWSTVATSPLSRPCVTAAFNAVGQFPPFSRVAASPLIQAMIFSRYSIFLMDNSSGNSILRKSTETRAGSMFRLRNGCRLVLSGGERQLYPTSFCRIKASIRLLTFSRSLTALSQRSGIASNP